MKNKIVIAALAGSLFLSGCTSGSKTNGLSLNPTSFANITNNQKALNSLMVMDMTSSLSLLSSSNLGVLPKMKSSSSEQVTSNEDKDIPALLSSLDILLTNDLNFDIKEVTSTNPDYAYQISVTYTDIDNVSNEYSLFYNSVKTETELEDDEEETKVSIEGISIIDEINYSFELESKTETSKKENESEVEFLLYLDSNNYVKVENSLEVEQEEKEIEYRYKKVTDGIIDLEYKLSLEEESGKEEIKLKKGNNIYRISSYEKDNMTLLKVEKEDKTNNTSSTSIYKKVITEVDGVSNVTYIPYTE